MATSTVRQARARKVFPTPPVRTGPAPTPHDRDDGYNALRRGLAGAIQRLRGPLFETGVTNLFQAFLSGLPVKARSFYTCKACERFINRFGGLAKITDTGPGQVYTVTERGVRYEIRRRDA